jgi:DinB superfamily
MREEAEMSKGKKTTRTPRRKGTGRANSGTGNDKALREHLAKVLIWGEAHADWKQALEGLDPSQRGIRPAGSPYSAWELLEHARISQQDILDFSTNPHYVQRDWPAEYWPKTVAPPDNAMWERSVKEFAKDTQAMIELIEDPRTDLFAKIAHGTGQTILRQALLLADHNAYHLGQFVLVRRLLGTWGKS